MKVIIMRDVTRAKIPSLCGAIWRTILNFYASQDVWVNCYRIHPKSFNFIYPFKFYTNFTNKNVSWLHFSWPTQYINYDSVSYCFCETQCRKISRPWNNVQDSKKDIDSRTISQTGYGFLIFVFGIVIFILDAQFPKYSTCKYTVTLKSGLE